MQLLFGQEMKQKLRILVLASSNAAVDIIAKRLLHIREKMDSGMCDTAAAALLFVPIIYLKQFF